MAARKQHDAGGGLPPVPLPSCTLRVRLRKEGYTKKDRLRQAIARDNGGVWFLVESDLTYRELERRFDHGLVGRILYKRVGGILKGPRNYLFMQIRLVEDHMVCHEVTKVITRIEVPSDAPLPEWNVQCCLRELGIRILRRCEVTDVFRAKHY